MLNQCQHECRNILGSYSCLCPTGYRLLSNGKTCQGQCRGAPSPWCLGCHLFEAASPSPSLGGLFPASALHSAHVSLPQCPGRCGRVGELGIEPPSQPWAPQHPQTCPPLSLQMWMSAGRAQSSVARARCASTPVEVPSAWMCHAQLATGEAPAQGESCRGAGSAHPALLMSP